MPMFIVFHLLVVLANYFFIINVKFHPICKEYSHVSKVCLTIDDIYFSVDFNVLFVPQWQRRQHFQQTIFIILLVQIIAGSLNLYLTIESDIKYLQMYKVTDNCPLTQYEFENYTKIPIPDFMVQKTSATVIILRIVFKYSFWLLILAIFIAASIKENLIGLIYLIIGSSFLYFGTNIFTKGFKRFVIVFQAITLLTIFLVIFQLVVSIVFQYFLIDTNTEIVHKFYEIEDPTDATNADLSNSEDSQSNLAFMNVVGSGEGVNECERCYALGKYLTFYKFFIKYSTSSTIEQITLSKVDVVPFFFLIFYLRAIRSNYFRHVVIEQKALEQMPSQGVRFINENEQNRYNHDRRTEQIIMDQIEQDFTRNSKDLKKQDYYEPYMRSCVDSNFQVPHNLVVMPNYNSEAFDSSTSIDNEDNKNAQRSDFFLLYIWKYIAKGLDVFSNYVDTHLIDYVGIQKVLDEELAVRKQEIINDKTRQGLSETSLKNLKLQNQISQNRSKHQLGRTKSIVLSEAASKNSLFHFVNSIYKSIAFNIGNICFLLVILLQIASRGMLTFPLVLLLFLWGGLSVPMPYSRFWTMMICYVIFIIIALNTFDIVNALLNEKPSLKLIYFLGFFETYVTKSVASVLLVFVFINKYINKSFGLWQKIENDPNIPIDPNQAEAEKIRNMRRFNSRSKIIIVNSLDQLRTDHTTSDSEDEENQNADEMREEVSNERKNVLLILEDQRQNDDDHNSTEFDDFAQINPQIKSKKGILTHIKNFWRNLFHERLSSTSDVYNPMNTSVIIAACISLIFFKQFSPTPTYGDILNFVQVNFVPFAFLYLMLIHLFMIICDRAIYLRKNMTIKILFYILVVFSLNIYFFIILPIINHRAYINERNWIASLWYLCLCFYLLISSCQIRRGYAKFSIRQFSNRKYNLFTLIVLYVYSYFPFVHIIRSTLDWTILPTALSLTHFLTVEDIFLLASLNKCWRPPERDKNGNSNYRSIKKHFPSKTKYCIGFLILFFFLFIILFPLFFFTQGNPFFEAASVDSCTIQIGFEGFPSMIVITSSDSQMADVKTYGEIEQGIRDAGVANIGFLRRFSASEDVQLFTFKSQPSKYWNITEAGLESLRQRLVTPDDSTLEPDQQFSTVRFFTNIQIDKQTKSGWIERKLKININIPIDNAKQMATWLEKNSSTSQIEFTNIIPIALHSKESTIVNASLELSKASSTFMLKKQIDELSKQNIVSIIPQFYSTSLFPGDYSSPSDDNDVIIAIFNDRVASNLVSIPARYGIIGLYLSFVFIIERLARSYWFDRESKVIFNEDEDVDPILDLCYQLYLVRAKGQHNYECFLASKLMHLYQDPSFKHLYTTRKRRGEEDEANR